MTPVSTDVKRKTKDASKARAAGPLSAEELRKMHAYWRAANYLSVGQIYLYDNPLLKEPLQLKHVKPRLLGHWGTTPGLNFIDVHRNRVLKEHDLNVLYVAGFRVHFRGPISMGLFEARARRCARGRP